MTMHIMWKLSSLPDEQHFIFRKPIKHTSAVGVSLIKLIGWYTNINLTTEIDEFAMF